MDLVATWLSWKELDKAAGLSGWYVKDLEEGR
jgi:hypothetical protein